MKTTKKQFKLFQQKCKEWINILGLKDWEIHIEHASLPFETAESYCAFDVDGHNATIVLNVEFKNSTTISDRDINRCAFHEMCHLLFAKFSILACNRFIMKNQLDEEEHAIIRVLENMVFED